MVRVLLHRVLEFTDDQLVPPEGEIGRQAVLHRGESETHEDLPQLPDDVIVPDDISNLKLPAAVRPTRRPVRWLRRVPVGLGLAAGGLVLAVVINDGGTDTIDPVVPNEVVQDANTPWQAGEGPGSTSLHVPAP